MITCRQCREEMAEHALGHDSSERRAAMDEHLATCPVCAHEMAMINEAWSALPMSLPPSTPPADLFDRIVARIDETEQKGSHVASLAPAWQPEVAAHARPLSPPLGRRERVLSYVLAASVLLGLTAGYVYLLTPSREGAGAIASVERLTERLNQLQRREVDRLLQSEQVRIVSLHRPETPTAAQALVLWDLPARQWHFYASDLPPAPAGRAYQLWVETTDGTLLAGPTFSVSAARLGSVVGDFPTLLPGDAAKAVVTIEPAGGSKSPSGETVLEAEL